ncbi:1,2-dihydroxy-3-keto-5-methylthiopentene dioxygenase [Acidithiobacillus sulfuriphilus]|uniref:Acireductone dioxygenase n=2 Tax=Acidithiobacillus sulfuriphilus TaxID=1867749 RepID=A0A3M8S7I7_9PROT|nr:cupin domain-containing protein [Acidithiobacillus sulfuriphilus]RNF76445.1 cupin domain-containing protein [Acidithiobacillus sulfuriphilus]
MASLRFYSGELVTDGATVAEILAPLGVTLQDYPVQAGAAAGLLQQASLTAAEQEEVLAALDTVFQRLRQERGYQARDLVVMYPEHPDIEANLARFHRIHTHDDEEVRYIIAGEGVFGFVLPDDRQVEVTVAAGDFIQVPAGLEHWFRLTGQRRIKAVRYFSARSGWVPHYSDRPLLPFG